MIKNVKHLELKESVGNNLEIKCCNCFFEYVNFKDDLIEFKCLCCSKNYQLSRNVNY